MDKRWEINGREWFAVALEFYDVTLAKEAVQFRCNAVQGTCTAQEVGPIALPSIGIEGGF